MKVLVVVVVVAAAAVVVVVVRTMERGENALDLPPKKGETIFASWDGSTFEKVCLPFAFEDCLVSIHHLSFRVRFQIEKQLKKSGLSIQETKNMINIAPARKPSHKESCLPTMNFEVSSGLEFVSRSYPCPAYHILSFVS